MKLRTRMLIVPLVAGVFVVVSGAHALAVHDLGVFELEGNIADGGAAGDDWATLYGGGGGGGLLEFSHVADGDSPADTSYLHMGGSKDVNDISEWNLTSNDEAPDKDEIINAFAAAYKDNGDMLVYFAADRFSNDGDAQVGFWFVQDDVTVGGGSIDGEHTVGDVLVLSDFVNGGAVSEVRVFEWVGGKNPLNEITPPSAADCSAAPAGDDACALVNNAIVTGLPWPYTPKANVGDPQTYPVGAFYEGGVNLTDLGVTTDCFSTFIAETRTSQALDARLKDIAVGDFNTCATKSGTKFEDLNADGDRDAGEPGLSGWEIHLFGDDDQGNPVHLHDTTDGNGDYSFENLEPGEYTVCETQQSGWTQSMPGTGAGTADCSGHTHGGTTPGARGYAIDLEFGDDDSGNDFGNFRMASKSGTKFEDLNADGDEDAGEPGVSGVQIHLFGTDGLGNAVHRHTSTDASGDYSFSNVAPGSYTVCETVAAGWTQSYPASGADCSGHGGGVGYSITLTSNEADTGNDFGNFRQATKAGTKFEDLNADGDRDAGEPGLEDWQIHLFGTDGQGNSVHEHDTTDANGDYSFSVDPGNYTVCETQQNGWTQSMPGAEGNGIVSCAGHDGATGLGYAISLDSNETDSGNDFGNYRAATKSGTKFEDLNADGDRDAGEPGLSGWEIHIFDQATGGDVVHQHATTDSNGAYSFDVPPGTYIVCETQKNGWTQSMPGTGAGTTSCSSHTHGATLTAAARGYVVTFTSGGSESDNDFGNFRQASKAGTKFEDLNADGDRDAGEPGVAGVQIHLFGTDGQGNAVHRHETTGADGSYSFANVAPGSYTVCETVAAGWTQSYPESGADCSGHGGGVGYSITLDSNEADMGNDFGNFRQASKSGTKFEDLNANGGRDEGEPGLEDWQIHLFGTDGQGNAVHEHTLTDADGDYSFTVNPGSYTVCETLPAGWTQSMPASGADCSAHGGGVGYAITLTSNESETGNDFGNYQAATKSGTKFNDLDADSVRDAGEPGLADWEIHLFGTAGDGSEVHQHAITDADGAYSFTVAPGSYTVCETQVTGWTQSYPASGADCSEHGGGVGYSIVLISAGVDAGNDFGNFLQASVSGVKFNDLDGDGVRDEGEPLLPEWQITLIGTSGQGDLVFEQALTDGSGAFTFTVPPGSYTICETQQGDASTSPSLTVEKTADPASGSPGDDVTYTYVITNTGTIDLSNVVALDDVLGPVGDPIASLPAGASVTRSISTTMPAAAGGLTNTVSVTADADWVQTFPAEGVDCSENGGGVGYEISLVSGDVRTGVDFGNVQRTVSASDTETITVVLAVVLVKTGADGRIWFELGMVLLGVGVALVALARRRERRFVEDEEAF